MAWAAALAAFALASGALAWGAAAGWSDASFRVYYLGGALLTAPLLGVGSLLLIGRRLAAPAGLVYVGLAVGIMVAVQLQVTVSGSDVPEAQEVLDLWPARVLAIAGNAIGTIAVVAVAVATFRRRPAGNALVLAGVAVAALGTALAGLGVGALAPSLAVASLLLYAGFVAPSRRVVLKPRSSRLLRALRSRSQMEPKRPITANATAASAIAPGIPPCARTIPISARGSTALRR